VRRRRRASKKNERSLPHPPPHLKTKKSIEDESLHEIAAE
jgi:hypothetical protein